MKKSVRLLTILTCIGGTYCAVRHWGLSPRIAVKEAPGAQLSTPAVAADSAVIERSRLNTVEVLINGQRAGTGFLLDPVHVITCFHVAGIARVQRTNDGRILFIAQLLSSISIRTLRGEEIKVVDGSTPTQQDPSPLLFDFAVLELAHRPHGDFRILPFATNMPAAGSMVYFSGFPLNAPFMLTHRGMVSGMDNELIAVEAPTNRGNSGSALISEDGKIIGIISQREGFVPSQLVNELRQDQGQGRVEIDGVDPVRAMADLTGTVDKYISTGIGYARVIGHVRHYLAAHRIAGYHPVRRTEAGRRPIPPPFVPSQISISVRAHR